MSPDRPGERVRTGPRQSLPHSDRDPTPARPAALSAETSAMLELMREELDRREARLALRLQTAARAEQSAELTIAHRSIRRNKGLAAAFGTALGVTAVVFSTAWGVYRDARATAIDVAHEAKASTDTLEDRVAADEARHDKTAVALTDLRNDVDGIGKAVTRLVSMLEQPPTAVVHEAPKRRPR